MVKTDRCTMVLLFNFAEPDWISVPCDKKLTSTLICTTPDKSNNSEYIRKYFQVSKVQYYTYCSNKNIAITGICYIFHWFYRKSNLQHFCKTMKAEPETTQNIMVVRKVFESLSLEDQFPPLVLETHKNTISVLKFQRSLNKVTYRIKTVAISQARGLGVCKYGKLNILIRLNLFICTKGGYISSQNICDGIEDCQFDKSDEENCTCSIQKNIYPNCKIILNRKLKICSEMYYMTFNGNCKKYTHFDKPNYHRYNRIVSSEESKLGLAGNRTLLQNQTLKCKNGAQIKLMFLDDLKFDCGSNGEDEPILMNLLKSDTYLTCEDSSMLPCKEGHSKCYFIHDICVYKLDINVNLFPCQNGGHLHECINFECNSMYKCRDSYCIPWLYVCDGKWDCPDGDEEDQILCTELQFCQNMYKCQKTTQKCLHLYSICDGKNDCPLGDDEQHCNLKYVQCPSECICLLMAISCYNVSTQTIYSKLVPFPIYLYFTHHHYFNGKN